MPRFWLIILVAVLAFLSVVGSAFRLGQHVEQERQAATATFDASTDGPFGPQYDLLSCLADLERYEQASGLTLEHARNLVADTTWTGLDR